MTSTTSSSIAHNHDGKPDDEHRPGTDEQPKSNGTPLQEPVLPSYDDAKGIDYNKIAKEIEAMTPEERAHLKSQIKEMHESYDELFREFYAINQVLKDVSKRQDRLERLMGRAVDKT